MLGRTMACKQKNRLRSNRRTRKQDTEARVSEAHRWKTKEHDAAHARTARTARARRTRNSALPVIRSVEPTWRTRAGTPVGVGSKKRSNSDTCTRFGFGASCCVPENARHFRCSVSVAELRGSAPSLPLPLSCEPVVQPSSALTPPRSAEVSGGDSMLDFVRLRERCAELRRCR